MIDIAVGVPPAHGVVLRRTSESSLLKASTPMVGASLITTDWSETRRMIVDGAVCPCCGTTDWLEFSAIKVESLLATTLAKSSGVAYVLRDVTLPLDSCTTKSSEGQMLTLLTTIASSLRKLYEAILKLGGRLWSCPSTATDLTAWPGANVTRLDVSV